MDSVSLLINNFEKNIYLHLTELEMLEYTTSKWKDQWINSPHYTHTKLFYESPSKSKAKYILKMGTSMLSTWIKGISGHNNCAVPIHGHIAAVRTEHLWV